MSMSTAEKYARRARNSDSLEDVAYNVACAIDELVKAIRELEPEFPVIVGGNQYHWNARSRIYPTSANHNDCPKSEDRERPSLRPRCASITSGLAASLAAVRCAGVPKWRRTIEVRDNGAATAAIPPPSGEVGERSEAGGGTSPELPQLTCSRPLPELSWCRPYSDLPVRKNCKGPKSSSFAALMTSPNVTGLGRWQPCALPSFNCFR